MDATKPLHLQRNQAKFRPVNLNPIFSISNPILSLLCRPAWTVGLCMGIVMIPALPAQNSPAETSQNPCAPTGKGGSVNFANRIKHSGIDGKVFQKDGKTPLAGTNYLAQLYSAPCNRESSFVPADKPVPFRLPPGEGYISASIIQLPNVGPRQIAYVQIRAWDAQATSYEEAVRKNLSAGKSKVIPVTTGGSATPGGLSAFPPELSGLNSFSLSPGDKH